MRAGEEERDSVRVRGGPVWWWCCAALLTALAVVVAAVAVLLLSSTTNYSVLPVLALAVVPRLTTCLSRSKCPSSRSPRAGRCTSPCEGAHLQNKNPRSSPDS